MTGSADQLEEPAKGVASQNKYLTLGGCQGDGAKIIEIFDQKQRPADDGKRCEASGRCVMGRRSLIYIQWGGVPGRGYSPVVRGR